MERERDAWMRRGVRYKKKVRVFLVFRRIWVVYSCIGFFRVALGYEFSFVS